jgi:hypothetical protein
VSRLTLPAAFEVHVFYVAPGYSISCLRCALLANAVMAAAGLALPGSAQRIGFVACLVMIASAGVTEAACAVVQEIGATPHRHRSSLDDGDPAVMIQQAALKRQAARFL